MIVLAGYKFSLIVLYIIVNLPVCFASSLVDMSDVSLKRGGEEVHYVGSAGSTVNITGVKVYDDVDGLSLDITNTSVENREPDFCEQKNGFKECHWKNVLVRLDEGVRAVDIYANFADEELESYNNYALEIDSIQPEVLYLRTSNFNESKSFVGNEPFDVIAKINETQSGFDMKKVHLSLTQVTQSVEDDAVKTHECIYDDAWYCYWYSLQDNLENSQNVQIVLSSSPNPSEDDVGNNIHGVLNTEVRYDSTNPQIKNISYSTPIGDCAVTGQKLEIKALVGDNAPKIYMTANFTDIGTTESITTDCNEAGEGHECVIDYYDVISSAGHYPVQISISDGANTVNDVLSVKVCELNSTSQVPNCASASFDEPMTNPSHLDRKAASYTRIPLMVPVHLNYCPNGNAFHKSVDCQSNDTDVSRVKLISEESDNPVIMMYLKNLPESDTVKINCTMENEIAVGTSVYEKSQKIPINLEVPLYNNPLGTLDENYNDKIGKLDEEIEDLSGEIEDKEKLNTYFSTLCSTAESLGIANSALQDAKNLIFWGSCGIENAYVSTIEGSYDAALTALMAQVASCCNNPGGALSCCTPCSTTLAAASIAKPSVMAALAAHNQPVVSAELGALTATAATCPGPGTVALGEAYAVSQSWAGLNSFWVSTCEFGNTFHDLVERYAWPSSWDITKPIGLVVKASCMVYSCRLCSGDFWGHFLIDMGTAIHESTQAPAAEAEIPDSMETDYDWAGDYNYGVDTTDEDGTQSLAYTLSGQETDADASDPESWLWAPYKSIDYAEGCLCLPGIIYNLKKEQQIKCMQKDCLTQAKSTGISTAYCDLVAKERYCLYVKSAQGELHGFLGSMFTQAVMTIMESLPYILAGFGYMNTCPSYQLTGARKECVSTMTTGICGPSSQTNFQAVMCGAMGSLNSALDLMDFMSNGFNFDEYNARLEGTDYCGVV